ncbi:peroxiredoxin family protein [Baaleninema simplex]|uniref:peroxiredoxin family protein n=1 Tax=Baaleninema simplex TaxID=2862350 RepID=UPI000346EEB3|nr:redoxin domain-containing protein [Baaleninema simplex]
MLKSIRLTSTDFRGLLNPRFFKNFLPFPATNQSYYEVATPDFELPDITNQRRVRLRDYRGKQPVVLAFTRIFTEKQYCPLCFPHLVQLNEQYETFQALGVEVFTIASIDERQSQIVVRDLGLKLPLLSDSDCNVFRAYRVGQALGAPLPAQFVLDRQGKLRYKHLFSFLEPNAPTEMLLEKAESVADSQDTTNTVEAEREHPSENFQS